MCLSNLVIKKPLTNKVRVYKIVTFEATHPCSIKKLTSAFKCNVEWTSGIHISSREEILGVQFRNSVTKKEFDWKECNFGFHVFTDRKTAQSLADSFKDFVIAVTAYTKDYVCSGDFKGSCAVYSRLTVEKREYQRTMDKVKIGIPK